MIKIEGWMVDGKTRYQQFSYISHIRNPATHLTLGAALWGFVLEQPAISDSSLSWPGVFWNLIVCCLVTDLYFYGTHWALHTRHFKHLHHMHHLAARPDIVHTTYASIAESLLVDGGTLIIGPLATGFADNWIALSIWSAALTFYTSLLHCSKLACCDVPVIGSCIRYHLKHHQSPQKNFGLTPLIDWLCSICLR